MNSPLPASTPLVTFVGYLDQLTGERQRPPLEKVLVEAVRELASARRVAYFKLQETAEETLFWLAVDTDANGTRILDDGVNPPGRLASIDTRPEIAALPADEALQPIPAPGGTGFRLAQFIRISGSFAGFIELDVDKTPDAQPQLMITALLTTFRNVMCLLDYSEVDTLTGLLNRKTFDEHLISILASLIDEDDSTSTAKRLPKRRHATDEPTCHWLAVIDIDHFKSINDSFGHLIGDEVLLLVANMMKTSFRFRDKLFRFGGEEFVVVLKPTGATQALAIFERFRAAMESFVFPQVGRVTISVGFARIHLHDQPSVILDHADQALYWSKEHGRNRVAAYEALIASGDLAPPTIIESDIEFF
jgi:diguanylate cyclase (GGDEF)-like protein